jgi:aldose 1-epimerase
VLPEIHRSRSSRVRRILTLALLLPVMTPAANYSAQTITVDGIPVVRLSDAAHRTEVFIVPSIGNMAYDMKVNGKPILWSPYEHLAQLKEKPVQVGVPFLAPWANRLSGESYYVNGKKYLLNPELGNYRRDSNQLPIHGLLVFAAWQVKETKADSSAAEVTSRLEFWRHPAWMAQFPFAHTLEMTYRLADGVLEVRTRIENQSDEPMPVSVGFHPYYQILDAPRDEWKVRLPVRDHYTLSAKLVPTGEVTPAGLPESMPLAGRQLDDVFGAITGEFAVEGKAQKITVRFGPKYPIAVVFAPPGRNMVCFEPMTAITDVFNLAHAGKYSGLQTIAPGETWQESFWIKPSGW